MVVICLPTPALTGMTQERTALPSTCTVHAPHCATPHPYLVPVRPTSSRMAHSSGVLGLTLTSIDLPLIVKRAMALPPADDGNRNYLSSGTERQAASCLLLLLHEDPLRPE